MALALLLLAAVAPSAFAGVSQRTDWLVTTPAETARSWPAALKQVAASAPYPDGSSLFSCDYKEIEQEKEDKEGHVLSSFTVLLYINIYKYINKRETLSEFIQQQQQRAMKQRGGRKEKKEKKEKN